MTHLVPSRANREQQVDQRLRDIERRISSLPIRSVGGGGGTTQLFYAAATIGIQGGQELAALSGVYGIKRSATALVATNYPHIPQTATATASISSGAVSAINVTFAGGGYSVAPTVTIAGGGGTGATATATLGGRSGEAIAVTNVGSGYTSAPTVSFSGGGGSGMSATAILSGDKVVAVRLGNKGVGYTSAPTVSFSGGGGTGAAATCILTEASGVVSISVGAGGSGYTTAPTVTIAAPPALNYLTDSFDDGFGWGRVGQTIFGSNTPTASSIVRVFNDTASVYPYALYFGESLLTFHSEYRRLSTEAAGARGCILGWIPDGVIA